MPFSFTKDQQWQPVEPGIERCMVNWNDELMAVKVRFKDQAVGVPHQHQLHTQLSFVLAGRFEVTLGERVRILEVGDSFLAPKDCLHGVVALENDSILLDVFTPARRDFVPQS